MSATPAAVKALFLEAAAMDDPAARAALLAERCGEDAELLARVNALLAANDRAVANAGTVAEPTADHAGQDIQAGAVVAGKYTLVEMIGEGGMGSVWRAKQTEPVKRFVAVKFIKAGMDSKQVLARFEAERQALALMDHPNIARVLDGGLHEQRPFFVMELVKGVPITSYCDQCRLTPQQRLELFVPVCQAIQHAHQKGIIHRDIKPSNVLIALYDDKPVVKVIDFGVAKATGGTLTARTLDTGFGAVLGTPQYMSPEQATFNNLDIDTRSDVYGLGVLLYELLTGSPPFSKKELEKKGLLEMLRVVREEEPPRPSTKLSTADALPTLSANRGTEPRKLTSLLRNELDWIVMKALEKDRTRRYETASGFAADVQRYLAGEPVLAHPPSTAYRLRKFVRRNRAQGLAASLVLLALVGGVLGTTLGMVQANQAAEAERSARDEAVKQQRLAEQAADQERKAKEREADRAEGERQAKIREGERADGELKAKVEAQVKRQEAERNLAFAKKGNEILGSVFAGLDPKQIAESGRPLQDILRENLSKAVMELEGSAIGDPLEVAKMQNTLGWSLLGLGEAALAVEVFQKALDTRKAELGPDHPDTLHSMHNLAMAYRDSGQLVKAVPLFEDTLEKCKDKLGPDDPRTLVTTSHMAQAYLASGQLAKAVPLLEETLEKRKATLGPDHPDTLTSMGDLAAAYRERGQLAKAVPLFEESLEKHKAKLGPDHPYTLSTMNSLAVAYRVSGQLAKAVPLLEEALDKRKATLGPDHPHTLNTMSNLAVAYRVSGQVAKAVPLLEETLEKQKTKLGPDHPDTLTSMNSLALAYQANGQMAKAVPLLEETLEKRKAKLGNDHPTTLYSMNILASAYRASGQLAKALPLFEETLEKRKTKLGPDHPDTLQSMNNLALAYKDSGQLGKAIPLYEETLEKAKGKLGPDHPDTLLSMGNLGQAYALAKQGDKAAATFGAFVDGKRKASPKDSAQFAALLAQVSRHLLNCGQHVAAEPLLRECLANREKTQPDAWTTFNTMSMLGGALLGQKKYVDAEPLLLKGYDGMKAREKTIPQSGGGELRIPNALDRLIEFCTATNQQEELKKWRAERAKYPAGAQRPGGNK
jgi:serine/threonine protein kinase